MIALTYVWQGLTLSFAIFCLVWATLLFRGGDTFAGIIFLIYMTTAAFWCLTGHIWRKTLRIGASS